MINTIELKGEKHPVRFSFNAIAKLQEILGENPFSVKKDSLASPITIRAIVYCALWGGYREENKEMPFHDVLAIGDVMDLGDTMKYVEMFVAEMSRAKKKEGAK